MKLTSKFFKDIRQELGLKQRELAALLGLRDSSYISKYENKISMPTGETVLRLLELRKKFGRPSLY